ncbi:MAG TPA: glycosyltransferase, partial [Oscillatoriaceae cyanobacterium]
PRVLWSVRTAAPEDVRQKPMTRGLIRLGAMLSDRPEAILYNSRTSAGQHEALGYAADKTRVIPNGFELGRFGPDAEAYRVVREELGVPAHAGLIGLFGRYHPVKDQAGFLRAASLLAPHAPDWYYVLAGRDVDAHNAALQSQIAEAGLEGRVRLLGERRDMPRLFAAMDVVASASKLEAFSNVIGEAMASGVPCVVTDVGDSAWIVGDTGRAVPPEQPQALADALAELVGMDVEARRALGRAARARVSEHFAIEQIAAQYERLYAAESELVV